MCKIKRETLSEDASAIIFLLILICCVKTHTVKYFTYLLKSADFIL